MSKLMCGIVGLFSCDSEFDWEQNIDKGISKAYATAYDKKVKEN